MGVVAHKYASGRQAAFADGWCVTCLKRPHADGYTECDSCRERKDLWCKKRNEMRPTSLKTRKKWQDAFDGLHKGERGERG